jgi:hypothetical protein
LEGLVVEKVEEIQLLVVVVEVEVEEEVEALEEVLEVDMVQVPGLG